MLQSCLLVIDTVILPATVSSKGDELTKSLMSLNKNVYQPLPPPPFVPVDFGEASRLQHQINVALTALCNCSYLLVFYIIYVILTFIPILAFERTLPQLQEMVELGGMKIKKVHATRFVFTTCFVIFVLIIYQGMGVDYGSCTSLILNLLCTGSEIRTINLI